MSARRPDPPSVRYLAYVIWSLFLAGVIAVGIVAVVVAPRIREGSGPAPEGLSLAAALVNVVLLAAFRFIPRVMPEEVPPLTKNVVATAACEAGALFAAVAWLLTGSGDALAGMVMGLGGIALGYPNDTRWRELGGEVPEERPGPPRAGGGPA